MAEEKKFRKARLVPLLLIVILMGAFAYWRVAWRAQNGSKVSASGTIEAVEMDVSTRVAGRIAILGVDEGDAVKKGQVIAVLDAPELKARVTQTQGAMVSAEAKLADLAKGSREERVRAAAANYEKALAAALGGEDLLETAEKSYRKSTELKSSLASADANCNMARRQRDEAAARLTLVKKGPRAEEVARLEANVGQVEAQLTAAEQDHRRQTKLYDQGAISRQQLDASLAARDSLRKSLESVEALYAAALAGSRPEEIDAATAGLAEADARLSGAREMLAAAKEAYADRLESLQRLQIAGTNKRLADAQVAAARAELDLMLSGATSDELEAARGQVELAKGALVEAQSQLAQATILAPEDGVVTVKFREVGEVIVAGTPIVRLANLDRVWLRVYAPLPTLGRIKVGQSASVSTDTYKGRVYEGKVVSIKEEPEFTPKNVQTSEERVKLVYAIRIDIDNRARDLKPGMPADADIDTAADR